jgi:holo-[acyl-carrier protein] synthase
VSIVGIGVDIERIDRFRPSSRSQALEDRVFTNDELEYCRAQAVPERHFAARFAAKEAAVKALGVFRPGTLITEVEVYKEGSSPVPRLRLIGDVVISANLKLHVSMSHADSYATAFVIAELIDSAAD